MWEQAPFLGFCFQLNCMVWIRGKCPSLNHKRCYKDTGEKPRLLSNCTLKEVSSHNHSRIQEKEGRVAFPNATGKRVGTEKTEIFPFISTCRYSSIPASSPTHWHWQHPLTGSSCSCLHSFQNGNSPFSSYCFLQKRNVSSLSAANNIQEGTLHQRFCLCGWWQHTNAQMPPALVTVLHALLPPLEPPCGCSPNYSPPVSFSATALLHSCLCKVEQTKRNTEPGHFRQTPQKWEKPRCTTNPPPALERKEMKQLEDKDGHSRSSSYTVLCIQKVKAFFAKAGGGRVLGKLSRWFHSKDFFLDMLRKAKGLTLYRPSAKGGSSAHRLSEEGEALIFVAIITQPCMTLHRIALGELLAWHTLPPSCSQPEKPACTSRLHMASLCSGIQRKVYIIPHRGADVGFPEQQ